MDARSYTSEELLGNLCPSDRADVVERWANSLLGTIGEARPLLLDPSAFIPVFGRDLPATGEQFARFVNGALLCDWSCYSVTEDRAEYTRLRNVISTFQRGFTLWLSRSWDGAFTPAAYTGWYPISRETFDRVFDHPEQVKHRRELWPQPTLSTTGAYIWLFNYCIAQCFRQTAHSRAMLEHYRDSLRGVPCAGLAAAVLSDESVRVVKRFGMTYRGNMTHDGAEEQVYATRQPRFD